MSNVASIKDRLKNRSQETNKTMQELLTAYGLERTIYRLSISKYRENFILKGGIFLYAVFDGNFSRATTDIDFLAQKISNDVGNMKEVFAEIFSLETDDPLRFDLNTLEAKTITEFKEYHGVNISIMSFLDRTRIPVSIDIGFGDIIYPNSAEMKFPVVLSDEPPHIFAYSLYSSVAEKFEAVVSLAYDNSRFKDYYDLYVLAAAHEFDGKELTEAVKETFENRHTPISEIAAFEDGFAEDPLRQSRWKSFVKKKRAMMPLTFGETINMIQKFMGPVADAVKTGKEFGKTWDPEKQVWYQKEELAETSCPALS